MKIQVVLIVITSLFPGRLLFAQDAGQKPNILWIITDDQRPDSIAAFNRIRRGDADSPLGKVLSPNIDRLAAMGTTFINTFNQNPSCAPSRTIMHTGRYSHQTGVYGFEYYNPVGLPHWKPMVPEILRDEAGYQTITVGKLGIRDQHFANKKNPNGPLLYQTEPRLPERIRRKGAGRLACGKEMVGWKARAENRDVFLSRWDETGLAGGFRGETKRRGGHPQATRRLSCLSSRRGGRASARFLAA